MGSQRVWHNWATNASLSRNLSPLRTLLVFIHVPPMACIIFCWPISLIGLHILSPLPDRECLQDSAVYESFFSLQQHWPTVGIYEWINGHKAWRSFFLLWLNIYLNYTHVIHDYIPIAKHSKILIKLNFLLLVSSLSPLLIYTAMQWRYNLVLRDFFFK